MLTFLFLNQTQWCDPHWNRLSETIPMSVTSQGLVEKWESYHENSFVHYFLTVVLMFLYYRVTCALCRKRFPSPSSVSSSTRPSTFSSTASVAGGSGASSDSCFAASSGGKSSRRRTRCRNRRHRRRRPCCQGQSLQRPLPTRDLTREFSGSILGFGLQNNSKPEFVTTTTGTGLWTWVLRHRESSK